MSMINLINVEQIKRSPTLPYNAPNRHKTLHCCIYLFNLLFSSKVGEVRRFPFYPSILVLVLGL